jgi:hypothetical protein
LLLFIVPENAFLRRPLLVALPNLYCANFSGTVQRTQLIFWQKLNFFCRCFASKTATQVANPFFVGLQSLTEGVSKVTV